MKNSAKSSAKNGARRLVRGGRILDPSQDLDAEQDLLIEDGRVAQIGPGLEADDADVVDASGLVVVPGLIDGRVHFGEPGYEPRETLESGLAAAAAGGFTSAVHYGWSDPEVDHRAMVESLLRGAEAAGTARLLPVGAVSKGRRGEELAELGELAEAGCVAFSDGERPVERAALLRRALLYARHFGRAVACRALDPSLAEDGVVHEGPWSTRLGLPGSPAVAEEAMVARDLLLVEETGGRYHLASLTLGGTAERLRRAKDDGLAVSCDVTVHHLVLTDAATADTGFSPSVRVEPPLRPDADRQTLIAALADGTVDCIVSDHRPYHSDEKDVQFSLAPPGISSLETTVSLCLDRLVRAGHLELRRLVELLTTGPARVYGLDAGDSGAGTLRPGSVADVTFLDLDREVTVDPSAFRSRGRSTPYAGWTLRGVVTGTLLGGRSVGEA